MPNTKISFPPFRPSIESTFYHLLYKDRLNWTRHVIPVSFKCPQTGLYVEGYIQVVPNYKQEDIERGNDKIDVTYSCLPNNFHNISTISVLDLAPTRRNIYKYSETTKETIEYIPGISGLEVQREEHGPEKLIDIYRTYKGIKWTVDELNAMLNYQLTEDDLSVLTEDGTKYCMIDSEEKKAYVMEGNLNPHKYTEDMLELEQNYKDCSQCALGVQREDKGESVVFARGNFNNPEVFVIGEAPGVQEEREGIPFFPGAPAGGALDKVMRAAGFNPDNCYFTNAVLCRPLPKDGTFTQNGKPGVKHIKECNTRLKNQIAIASPSKIVLLGSYAYRAFFGIEPPGGVLSNSGPVTCENYKVFFMPHPSWVVRKFSEGDQVRKETKQLYLDYWKQVKEM